MKFIKIIILSILAATSLFAAIDSVSNLSANAPHNNTAATNDVTAVFTFTPPANDDKYYYKVDTNSSNTYALDADRNNWSIKTLTTEEKAASSITLNLATITSTGTYYLHIVAVHADESTSTTVTSTAMTIDITSGTVTMSPDGGSLGSVQSLTITGNETGTIYYTTDGTAPDYNATSLIGTTAIYTDPLSIITAKTVKARLKDTAGNKGDVLEKVFTSSVKPTAKTNDSNNTVAHGATFATKDTGNAVASDRRTAIKISDGNTTAGFTQYKYKLSTDGSYGSAVDINQSIDISGLNTGAYTYYILGGDAYNFIADDSSEKQTVTFTVDNDEPTSLTISYDDNDTITKVNPALSTQPGLLTLTATDSTEIKYSFSSTEPAAYTNYANTFSSAFTIEHSTVSDGSEGDVSLYIAAKDASGNWAKTNRTFEVDKKDPIITMPAAKSFSADFETTLSSNESGTIKYLVAIASGSTCTTKTTDDLTSTYSGAITISAGSNKCLYAIAQDEVGNDSNSTGSTTTVSSTLFTYSSSAITLDVTLTDNQTFATITDYNATATTDINVTMSSSTSNNVRNFSYEFDSNGTEINSSTTDSGTISELISLLSISQGEHNITIRGYKQDLTDANITEYRTFTIDNTPPSDIVRSSSFDASRNYFVPTYDLIIDRPVGATTVYYSENNGSVETNSSFTTASKTITITQEINATTIITAYGEDAVGNEGNRTSGSFTRNPAKTKILGASTLTFNSQLNFAKSSESITVTNIGNDIVSVDNISLSAGAFSIVSTDCNSSNINAGGSCSVTVDYNSTTTGEDNETLTITYMGGTTNFVSTELNISISGSSTNNTPTITTLNDINTSEDTNITGQFLGNDIDSDNTTLTFVVDSNGTKGFVHLLDTNGSYIYEPKLNQYGEDNVTIRVMDTNGSYSNEYNITVNIIAVNDAPLFDVNTTMIIDEDNAARVDFNITDIDNVLGDGNVTYETNATHGKLSDLNISGVTYTPDGNYTGTDQYVIRVSDGNKSVDKTIIVTVRPQNDRPNVVGAGISDRVFAVDQNFTYDISSFFADIDGDDLNYSIITPVSNDLNITNAGLINGLYSSESNIPVIVMAKDGSDLNITNDFNITIVNRPVVSGVSSNSASRLKVGDELNITVTFSEDINITNDGNITLTLSTGEVVVIGLADGLIAKDIGITGTITIGSGDSETITITDINVTGSTMTGGTSSTTLLESALGQTVASLSIDNTAPSFTTSAIILTYENNATIGHIVEADDADDNITFSLLDQNDSEHFDFNISTGMLDFNATKDYESFEDNNSDNNYSIVIKIQDTVGNIAEQNITVVLLNVNETPTIKASNGTDELNTTQTIDEDNNLTLTYSVNDIDIDNTLSDGNITVVSGLAYGTISTSDINITRLIYVPTPNYNGTDWFVVRVSDGSLYIDKNISVTIKPINDVPTIKASNGTDELNTTQVINEDNNLTLTYTVNDVDLDNTLTDTNITIVTAPSNGSISISDINTTRLIYVPMSNYNGSDSFVVRVSDGLLDVNKTINVTISPLNDTPEANTSAITVDENSASGSLSGYDEEGSNLTYYIDTNTAKGTIVLNTDGTFTYTPDENEKADYNDTLSYYVNDGDVNSSIQTVTLTITAVDDAPVFDSYTVPPLSEDFINSITLDIDATDAENDTITYILVNDYNTSLITIDINETTGLLTFTSIKDMNGDTNVTVVANTPTVDKNTTFNLSISAVDDLPVITTIAPQRAQIVDANFTVNIIATDVDGGGITYEANSSDTSVVVDFNTTSGLVTIDPISEGNATITVKAIEDGNFSLSTFTVTVKNTELVSTYSGEYNSTKTGDINTTKYILSAKDLVVDKNDSSGKVSIKLDGSGLDKDVNLDINVVGADIAVDANGTLTTNIVDGTLEKDITIEPTGKTTIILKDRGADINTTNTVATSELSEVELNTTVTSSGNVETKFTTADSSSVQITLDTTGRSTSAVTIGTKVTQVEITKRDTNTTVGASGDITTKLNLSGSRSVEFKVSTKGVITPTMTDTNSSATTIVPVSLPIGTKITVDDNSEKVIFNLKLDTTNQKIEFK